MCVRGPGPESWGMDGRGVRCPDCGAVGWTRACPRCGVPLDAPEIADLWQLDAALADLTQRRTALLHRRAALIAALRARRTTAPPGWGAAPPPRPAEGGAPVQTVLLALGAVLLTVAGLAFTLLSWGHLGIGGRAAVLAGMTGLAFAAHLSLRRRLAATAETAAAIGLVLVLLDCYAARAAGLAGLDGTGAVGYAAVVTAVVGIASLVYGSWARSVVLPCAGLVLLQAAPPLTAYATGDGPVRLATAFAAAAAIDLAAWLVLSAWGARDPRVTPEAVNTANAVNTAAAVLVARTAAAVMAVAGGGLGAAAALGTGSYATALRACGPLLMVAALAAATARRRELPGPIRVFAGVVTGATAVVAVAALPHAAASTQWGVPVVALPGAALAVAVPAVRRRAAALGAGWLGLEIAGAGIVGLAGLGVLPRVVRVLGEPVQRAVRDGGPGRLGLADGWAAGTASGPVVVALVAVVLVAAAAVLRRPAAGTGQSHGSVRELLECAAAVAGFVAVAVGAPAAGSPYGAALAVAWLPGLVAAVVLGRRPRVRPAAELCVLLASAALALVWSLPDDAAALTVWSATALLAAGLAAALRAPAPLLVGRLASGFAVLALGVVAARAALAAQLPVQHAAFAVLAVALLSVPVAAVLRSLPVEFAGYGVAVAALAMTVAHPSDLSFALAVAGCGALAVALRADRRQYAAPAGALLLTAASWVRLALAGVTAPEPYVLPVAAIALVLGHVRRRRVPSTGSWAAYGPGLAAGLVPSLGAALADVHWLRPLLLGLAALGVTLLGARLRLAAPLLLGGAVLAADAVHELTPAIVQTLGVLPRWAPLACAGLLLVFVGATYERRLADARRLSAAYRRFS